MVHANVINLGILSHMFGKELDYCNMTFPAWSLYHEAQQ
jgi:hypothetical protein